MKTCFFSTHQTHRIRRICAVKVSPENGTDPSNLIVEDDVIAVVELPTVYAVIIELLSVRGRNGESG